HDISSSVRDSYRMKELSKQVLLTRIAARLKALGTSANAIGPKAGVSRDFVRNIKRRGWPTLDNFWALAQALECSPFYLVGLTDNPTGDPYAEPLDISELKDFIAIAISEATQSGNHLTTEEIATAAAEAFAE